LKVSVLNVLAKLSSQICTLDYEVTLARSWNAEYILLLVCFIRHRHIVTLASARLPLRI